jgi:dihydroorotase
MAQILNIHEAAGRIEIAVIKDELESPLRIGDAFAYYEEEIPQSDTWSRLEPVELAAVMANYLKENTNVLEIQMKVNDHWIVKKYVTLERALFPTGIVDHKAMAKTLAESERLAKEDGRL